MPSKQTAPRHSADKNATVIAQPTEVNGMLIPSENKSEDEEEAEVVDKYAEIETQCGAGSWRPKALRPLGSLWMFTVAMSIGTIVANMNFTYYSAVITQIERRFGLSSAMTGFIKNIDNIGFMSTILVASHLGRHANKPRLLAASSFLSGIAIFLFAVPHFMYGGPTSTVSRSNATNVWNSTVQDRGASNGIGTLDVCVRELDDAIPGDVSDPSGGDACGSASASTPLLQRIDFHRGALFFFVLSELLQGAAISPKTTLSMTYMDDNAKDKSPQHFGFMFGMRAFAPMLGFLLGAWTNTIYVDLSKPDIDQKDPRWIGAWWIGFVICAVCTSSWAIPFLLFPKRFAGAEIEADTKREKNDTLMNKLKDLPKSLWRLLTNPVYVCCILGTGCNSTLMGFSTFLPKYYQSYFGVTPAVASIWTGVVTAMSFGIGNIVSGPIVSRLKASINRTLLFVIFVTVLSIGGYLTALMITCPEAEWAGNASPDTGFNGTSMCNAGCSCNQGAFTPVCGSDGRNYYSPCYAGCPEQASFSANLSKKVFTDCECVDGGTATLGLCERSCSAFYIYITVIFVTYLVTSMLMVPIMTVKMRCVDKKDKAMALALSAFFLQITSFPSPMLYGRAIDSICLVQQQGSCNRKGACLLYDHDGFRWRLHVLPLFAKAAAAMMYLTAWILSRKRFPTTPTDSSPNAPVIKSFEETGHSTLGKPEDDAKKSAANSSSTYKTSNF